MSTDQTTLLTHRQNHLHFYLQNSSNSPLLPIQQSNGQQNIVYKQLQATQSRIVPKLFAPVKTSRIRPAVGPLETDANYSPFDHQDSTLDPNDLMIREQISLHNQSGVHEPSYWTPGQGGKYTVLGQLRSPGPKVPELRDSPTGNASRRTNYYHLHLHVKHPPIESDDKNASTHNFNESMRSSGIWPKDSMQQSPLLGGSQLIEAPHFTGATSHLQWNSKLPLINMQLDQKIFKGSIINHGSNPPQQSQTPDLIITGQHNVGAAPDQQIPKKGFPARHSQYQRKPQDKDGSAYQSTRPGKLASPKRARDSAIVDIRSPFSAHESQGKRSSACGDLCDSRIDTQQKHDVGVGTATVTQTQGFKSILGGGYQQLKPEEVKVHKGGTVSAMAHLNSSSQQAKHLTPLRGMMNSTVMDSKRFGFGQDYGDSISPTANSSSVPSRLSPIKKEIGMRKKQLIAYHGWLKSKSTTSKAGARRFVIGDFTQPKLIISNPTSIDERIDVPQKSKEQSVGTSPRADGLENASLASIDEEGQQNADLQNIIQQNAMQSKMRRQTQKTQKQLQASFKQLKQQFAEIEQFQKQTRSTVRQTHIIPDALLQQQIDSFSSTDRDQATQQFMPASNHHFDSHRRSLKGLFKKTSKKNNTLNSQSPKNGKPPQVLSQQTTHYSPKHNPEEQYRSPQEITLLGIQRDKLTESGQTGYKELKKFSQTLKNTEFFSQLQRQKEIDSLGVPHKQVTSPFQMSISQSAAHHQQQSPRLKQASVSTRGESQLSMINSNTYHMSGAFGINANQGPPSQINLHGGATKPQIQVQIQIKKSPKHSPRPTQLITMIKQPEHYLHNQGETSRRSPRPTSNPPLEEPNSPSDDSTLALLSRICKQKNKKRRGKFNKNEALYEFIEQIQQMTETIQNGQVGSPSRINAMNNTRSNLSHNQ